MSGSERGLENRRLLVRLTIVAIAMFGFGFALAPLLPKDVNVITPSYTFFEVAGLGGRK